MNQSIPDPTGPAPGNADSAPLLSPERDRALDLARAAVTLLVIAHHAVLAYHRYAPDPGPFVRENLLWAAFPIVDAARAPVIDAFTLWNDAFFMALMFLLAGLFVPASLGRKGAGRFLRDRALRLGGGFVLSAAVLAPLAYFPAYWMRAGEAGGVAGFWPAWRALGLWPAGPAWFLWVLLLFSGIAAAVHSWAPRALATLAAAGAWCRVSPVRACTVLGGAALVAYLPVLHWINPSSWAAWGPFAVQGSRVGLYAVYFAAGYALAAGGRELPGVWMMPDGVLARRWQAWQGAAGGVFMAFVAALILWLTRMGQGRPAVWLDVTAATLFVATGAVTSFALLATLARWGCRLRGWATSLARNAFGMYLVHYAVVTWTQLALLGVTLPGAVKAVLVTGVGIGASWVLAEAWRCLPGWRWLEPRGR